MPKFRSQMRDMEAPLIQRQQSRVNHMHQFHPKTVSRVVTRIQALALELLPMQVDLGESTLRATWEQRAEEYRRADLSQRQQRRSLHLLRVSSRKMSSKHSPKSRETSTTVFPSRFLRHVATSDGRCLSTRPTAMRTKDANWLAKFSLAKSSLVLLERNSTRS